VSNPLRELYEAAVERDALPLEAESLRRRYSYGVPTGEALALLVEHSPLIEIGAGLGSLTLALADTGADVTALEVDRGMVPVLRDVVADRTNVDVVEGDAMQLDWKATLDPDIAWVLVANLPYNVATPLVCDLLDEVPQVQRILVMVQREVAERFAASPRTSAYGAVSVKAAYWGIARVVGLVPASVFVPRPNVESALVEITRHDPMPDHLAAVDPEQLFPLVKTAFGQRRKMLRKSLSGIVAAEQFEAAEVLGTSRPEELSVDDWVRLLTATEAATKQAANEPATEERATEEDATGG
jgi:16S rRNA (adenine1518-N6/adenine1519-N6)-dimethyltransferase